MKTSRRNWVAAAVVAGLLIAGGAGTAWGAPYAWDGNGSSDNSGNWSDTANWNPESAGKPDAGDDVTLPDVTAGTRTVTLDTNRLFRTLTINQSTAGATNRLLFNANLTSDSNTDLLPTLTASAGAIVIDKGSYDFKFTSGGSVRNWILGPNVILNSSGGVVQDTWQANVPSVTLQGTANFSTAVTAMGDGNAFTVDTTGVLNLTSGGGASVGNGGTITVKGTINGNNTGSLRARTLILDAGSAMPTAPDTIYATALQIKSTTPANFDMSAMTLRRVYGPGTGAEYEAASSGSGTNFKIGSIVFQNNGGTRNADRYRIVNNFDNSGDQANEYLLLGAFNASGAYLEEFDLNGNHMVIDGGVANYSGGDFWLSNRSAGHGVMEFRTTGGTLNLNAYIGVSGGGILEIVGPASISNASLYDPGTALGPAGGTIAFTGNVTTVSGMIAAFNSTNGTTTLDISDTNTFELTYSAVSAANGATFIVKGHVIGNNSIDGRGLLALGTAKSGATGAPVVTPSGTIIVSGNVTYLGNGLSTYIGRDATLKVGGNFAAGSWWNGIGGAANRSFFADTSPNAGSFIFNGGGGSVQTMEVLSMGYTAITGLSYFAASGAAPAATQTVTGDSSGA